MIIKELDFNAFCKLFLDRKEVLMDGVGFNSSGTVDVLLDGSYDWRLVRSSTGGVAIWFTDESESVWRWLGEVDTCDFKEITVC